MEEKVISVVHLNKLMKSIIDAEEMLSGILVSGEVTNFKLSGNHAYFGLKDDQATVACTFFNYRLSSQEYQIKNNDKIIARGKPDFYVKNGSFSFKVSKATPEGLGALYQQFLLLKEQLEKEGLFDQQYKKVITQNYKRIGVVTSPTGAVIRDIINVTKRRNPYVDIVLLPAKVQGDGADIDIARAVHTLDQSKLVDVIIVGRGGGSQEDLQCFNTEIVARAVFNCQTPIISAVGHETDFSLCDFASDLRAPTPSAAAELATFDFISEVDNFKKLSTSMGRKYQENFKILMENTTGKIEKLRLLGSEKISTSESYVKELSTSMLNNLRTLYMQKVNDLKSQMAVIEEKNPLKLMEKGFVKVSLDGQALTTTKGVKVDDVIQTHLTDGTIKSRIIEVFNKENI